MRLDCEPPYVRLQRNRSHAIPDWEFDELSAAGFNAPLRRRPNGPLNPASEIPPNSGSLVLSLRDANVSNSPGPCARSAHGASNAPTLTVMAMIDRRAPTRHELARGGA